jgi:hypothetical protein
MKGVGAIRNRPLGTGRFGRPGGCLFPSRGFLFRSTGFPGSHTGKKRQTSDEFQKIWKTQLKVNLIANMDSLVL